MAYTAATQYPSNSVLTVFTWGTPTSPNPRLAAPITSTATTITFTSAPLDRSAVVVTEGFLMGIRNTAGWTEIVYVAAGTLSADGLTATGVVRGIRPEGIDYTTGDASFAAAAETDSPVFCAVAQTYHAMMIAALQGTIGSGANNWKIGDGTDSDITITAFNGDGNLPFWRYDSATSAFVYSNDGVSSTAFGTGAGVTGGDGITVTAGDIDIDLTDTVIFKDARTTNEAISPITLSASGLLNVNFMPTNVQEADTFFGATDATGAEMETLTDGSDADSLHTHTLLTLISNAGQLTRAAATASGDLVVAHGLGRTPKAISFQYYDNTNSLDGTGNVDDDMNNFGLMTGSYSATDAIWAVSAARQRGVVSAWDATNFTITWTKASTGAEVFVNWIAIA